MDERQDQYPQQDQYQQTQHIPQPPQWGAPPPQAPGGYYAPPAPMPPVKARPRWKTPLIAAVALVVGIAIGAAAGGGSKNDTSSTASGSTSTGVTSSAPSSPAPAHSAAAPAAHSAAAAPAKSIVLQTSGNGTKTTKQFTVAADWSVKYSYDCSSMMGQGNFIVTENGGDNDGVPIVNLLGAKGSDVTYQHSDSGQHSLEINSECNWTVTVTSGDGG
jgi:hypothetical protein